MDTNRAMLDRELYIAGAVHDLRNSVATLMTRPEFDRTAPPPHLERAASRAVELLNHLADPPPAPLEFASFRGVTVRVRGPIAVLELALAALPCSGMTIELHAEHLSLTATNVPRVELEGGWTAARAEAWLEHGGAGLAGARLRVAARLVGALRLSAPTPPAGEFDGSVYLQLARG